MKTRSSPHPLPTLLSPVPTAISIPPNIARRLYAGPAAANVPVPALVLRVEDHTRAEVRNFYLPYDANEEQEEEVKGRNEICGYETICIPYHFCCMVKVSMEVFRHVCR